MNRLQCIFLSLSMAVGGLPTLAEAAPFMRAEGFLTSLDEQRSLNNAERAHLADIRSSSHVIRATVGACDYRAFSAATSEIDLPNRRSVALTRTREESSQFPSTDEHGTRMVMARSWIGKTDAGKDAIFSFVEGTVAGGFDEADTVVSVQQLNARLCTIIEYDPTTFPPD